MALINSVSGQIANIWNYTVRFCKLLFSLPGKERRGIKTYVPVPTSGLKAVIPCKPHFLCWLDLSWYLGWECELETRQADGLFGRYGSN